MHPTIRELFADTTNKTGHWLEEIMTQFGTADPRQAYSILRAVLHVLRDRLSADEAADLGAQLPLLVRGIYYDGWRPAQRSERFRHKADFLRLVGEAYPGLPEAQREPAARAVFKVLTAQVSGGEIRQVHSQLPAEVRDLWELAAPERNAPARADVTEHRP
jgi:uncharacterized protein (DUF2267 family)